MRARASGSTVLLVVSRSAASRPSAARSPAVGDARAGACRRRRGDRSGVRPRRWCSRMASAIASRSWSTSITLRPRSRPCWRDADVHRRHAEERALADGDARVADDRRGVDQQAQEVLGVHVAEEVDVLGLLAARGTTRMPFEVPSEPASTFGQNQSTGSPTSLHGVERLLDLLPRLLVLGRHRMLHDHEVAARRGRPSGRRRRTSRTDRSRAPAAPRTSAAMSIDGQPVTTTASGSSPRRITRSRASSVETRCRFDSLVTAWRTFSSIEPVTSPPCTCTTRDVHVGGGHRGGQRLVAVGDRDHDVGLQVVEHRRQLEQAEAGGLRRRHQVLALEHHVDALPRSSKPSRSIACIGVAVAVEQRRGGDDQLQLEVGMLVDRLQRGADAGVARPGGDDDADLPFGH